MTGTSVVEEFKDFRSALNNGQDDDPRIKQVFESEMKSLTDSDAVILLEPAGRSSLTEAGIAYGMGKKIILVGLVEQPGVVYRICERRYPSVDSFLDDLGSVASAT